MTPVDCQSARKSGITTIQQTVYIKKHKKTAMVSGLCGIPPPPPAVATQHLTWLPSVPQRPTDPETQVSSLGQRNTRTTRQKSQLNEAHDSLISHLQALPSSSVVPGGRNGCQDALRFSLTSTRCGPGPLRGLSPCLIHLLIYHVRSE